MADIGFMMESVGFKKLIAAPASILGQKLTLLHRAGATDHITFNTKRDVAIAIQRGWTRYRFPQKENRNE